MTYPVSSLLSCVCTQACYEDCDFIVPHLLGCGSALAGGRDGRETIQRLLNYLEVLLQAVVGACAGRDSLWVLRQQTCMHTQL